MPTSYTPNLRLSNPGLGDTGWGSTVSNGMIDLVDPAIAGTTTLSADTDVTLTTTNGMADQARQMILNCTGSRAAQRTITAPASSKVYVVINGTTGGFGVKIVGVGPTTGVVVPAGRMAVVAWNGSDFVTLGAVVDLHVAGQTRIQDSASASNYILIGSGTNAPRGGNSVMAQTGSMVMGTEAASSLFFVTNAATAMALDASGNLGIGTTSTTSRLTIGTGSYAAAASGTAGLYATAAQGLVVLADGFYVGSRTGSDRLVLDSSGNLGLGVTPSAWGANFRALELQYTSGGSVVAGQYPVIAANTYNDNTNWIYKTTAAASYYSQVTGQHRWHTAPSGTAGNAISFTQAMTLDASGDFLLGTASAPANGASARNVVFNNTNSASTFVKIANAASGATASDGFDLIMGTSSDAYVYNRENGPLIFGTNNTERARITGSGDLLVGTTSSSYTNIGARIIYDASNPYITNTCASSTNAATSYNLYSTGAGAFRFYVDLAGTVFATSTTISAISDQRLKENIRDLDVGLNAVMALKPRKFDWKTGKGKATKGDRGFIAQEFEQVFPDLIDEWKDPAPEGEEPYKSVRADLIPVLVKAMQEQQALIVELCARVAALEVK